jgi:regulator of sigma E protease
VNGETVEYFEDLPKNLLGGGGRRHYPGWFISQLICYGPDRKTRERKRNSPVLFLPRIPAYADIIPDSNNAYKAGLKQYDQIITVDGISTPFYDQVKKAFNAHRGQPVTMTVERKGETDTLHVQVTPEGTIGFYRLLDFQALDSMKLLRVEKTEYSFFASFPAGVHLAAETLSSYIDQFKKILSPKTEAYKGVGGFKSMGSIFPSLWDWFSFWNITAFFSIALAFMNILPIPALDGGHVLFTVLEMITGRKPSQKLLEYAQVAGMVILLALMLYVNGNDFFGWGKSR